jgi:hypothetical protein
MRSIRTGSGFTVAIKLELDAGVFSLIVDGEPVATFTPVDLMQHVFDAQSELIESKLMPERVWEKMIEQLTGEASK